MLFKVFLVMKIDYFDQKWTKKTKFKPKFSASTSTLKLPLSPRQNLMPSPSRAIASAIKHSNLLILIKWKRLWETNFISVIYSGNTLINPSFYVIYENDRDNAYKEVKRGQLKSILTSSKRKIVILRIFINQTYSVNQKTW